MENKKLRFEKVEKPYVVSKDNKDRALDSVSKELEYVCVGQTPNGIRTYAVRRNGISGQAAK